MNRTHIFLSQKVTAQNKHSSLCSIMESKFLRSPIRGQRPPLRSILRTSTRSLRCTRSLDNENSPKSGEDHGRTTLQRSVSFSEDLLSRWQESSMDLKDTTKTKETMAPRMPVRKTDTEDSSTFDEMDEETKRWQRQQAPRLPVRRYSEDELALDQKVAAMKQKRAELAAGSQSFKSALRKSKVASNRVGYHGKTALSA